jgi:hypothetical protein
MKLETPSNKNYAATVVALDRFAPLANADRLQAALIFGNSVIVSLDAKPGDLGLFFPLETALSREFLSANNLFRKPEWGNADATQKGYFEEHGRIKAVKFRGNKSEGFWIPLASLGYLGIDLGSLQPGDEFDKIGEHEICRKYQPKQNPTSLRTSQGRKPKAEDRIVEGQFHFHVDTENLRRNIGKVQPEDWVSISDKWHGTSAVFAHVLVKRELPWWERGLAALGVAVQREEYAHVWSSRRVVKGVAEETTPGAVHFYDSDIWGVVGKEIRDLIPKGYTVYGEIVGWTPEGGAIQPGYHYGCAPGTHRFLVYRVTTTNPDGRVLELSWLQMKEWTRRVGLEMVQELFYGRASNLHYQIGGDWYDGLLKTIEVQWLRDQMCPHNCMEVPAEGIVLRIERLAECEPLKLKNYRFLEWESKELDKGEVGLEEMA